MTKPIRLLRRIAGLALVSALTLTLAGCGKTYTYKYRITVTVRDHDRLVSASSVVSVEETTSIRHNQARPKLCGEATPVALANGRFVFALLNGLPYDPVLGQYPWRGSPTWILLNRLGLPMQWTKEDDSGIVRLGSPSKTIKLQAYEMPEFVTFKDRNDPETIERVDPEHPVSTLGEGVKFEGVSLEASSDEVTTGNIKPILPWLSSGQEYLDGSQSGQSVRAYHSIQFINCN